jgi:hypothetical protein
VAAATTRRQRERARAADALEGAVLQRAQQFGLQARLEFGDLVEEERPARGGFEAALAARVGAGEGAAFVAEEFALDHARRERGAVHVRERRGGARRGVVQQARDEPLAGSSRRAAAPWRRSARRGTASGAAVRRRPSRRRVARRDPAAREPRSNAAWLLIATPSGDRDFELAFALRQAVPRQFRPALRNPPSERQPTRGRAGRCPATSQTSRQGRKAVRSSIHSRLS